MSIPAPFIQLVDDAAIFPPGDMPLRHAVPAHAVHRNAAYAELVGCFVVRAQDLSDLAHLATPDLFPGVLRVGVLVPEPAQAAAVTDAVEDAPGLRLASLEVRLASVGAVADQVGLIAAALPPDCVGVVEAPRPSDPRFGDVLNAAATNGLMLKFRTGGTDADAFPSEAEVTAWITAAVGAGVAFKCTAGLHNAVRHADGSTGFEHHGYLNVLLATADVRAGVSPLASIGERDPHRLAERLRGLPNEALVAARTSFRSYGSCSVVEPLEDLAALGLVPTAPSIDKGADAQLG